MSSSWMQAAPMPPTCISLLPVYPNGLPLSNSPTIARRISSPNFSLKSLHQIPSAVYQPPSPQPPSTSFLVPDSLTPSPVPVS